MNVAVGCVTTLRCTAVRTFDLQTTHVELMPSLALGSEISRSTASSLLLATRATAGNEAYCADV